MTATSSLRADLYNASAIPTNKSLPDGSVGLWQPTVVTLISGKSEAVLVDTLFTSEQGVSLGDWIQDTLNGKKLSTIYITHGHGDHWFNLHYLVKRFPGVEVVSTQESIDHMSTQLTPEYRAVWHDLFPGQINEESFEIVAKPLKDNKFTLEGHTFEAVHAGHSDTDATTFLYVPSLNLTVAGDIVYNDVHMWMAESPSEKHRDAWIECLDKLEPYNPAIVIGSHHRPGGVDGAFNIGASREYIKTFSRLVKESKSAKQLYDSMLHAYPDRIGKLVLWLGCQAQFP
ncbi:Lactamase-B domain-containing protein [Fusarium keratoplasticum]|uniref:Lactamase-B domain-containing protein n=1 Tax=Fusarium keratoplasticum TaxID=1328300 RepID=A0ACC0QT60_9HYPO|nr:Lactamase-B domain-containing protein [Fusarium keratoplasticum]KAI8665832.1 Lactamase-B domain-containing protein [Fusarium keratoplasticum]